MPETGGLEFDWDNANTTHLKRHRVSKEEFEQAILNDPVLIDSYNLAGEERLQALSATLALRVLVLCYTMREGRLRPVTAWDAGKRLARLYFRLKGSL